MEKPREWKPLSNLRHLELTYLLHLSRPWLADNPRNLCLPEKLVSLALIDCPQADAYLLTLQHSLPLLKALKIVRGPRIDTINSFLRELTAELEVLWLVHWPEEQVPKEGHECVLFKRTVRILWVEVQPFIEQIRKWCRDFSGWERLEELCVWRGEGVYLVCFLPFPVFFFFFLHLTLKVVRLDMR